MANNLLGGATLNFKDKTLVVPSAIIVVSLVVLVAALLVGVFVPRPSTNGVGKASIAVNDVKRQITMLKAQQVKAGQTIAARTWLGSQNDVSAAVLANLTAQAKQEGLVIGSFRPQRPTDLSGVTDLPFAVQITGPYPGVRMMMRSLDTPASKVVLRSAQITAATNSTTDVSATLGLSAYLATDPVIVAAAAAGRPQKKTAKGDPKQLSPARQIGMPLAVTITSKGKGAKTHGRS